MSEAIQNSFRAVRFDGALHRSYRWDQPLPPIGSQVIVERPGGGEELVTVIGVEPEPADNLPHALALATPARIEQLERRGEFESKAFAFARQRARSRRLKLKFVRCILASDRRVKLFYATEGSPDLRDLMRDFAHELGAEVELVQLAEREAAGQLGGLGPCGRTTCCSTFLKVFPNPTTKMGKDQGVSLTPQKLSGRCGKLKCCLAYEADTYREALEEVALRVGHAVRSPKGYARIIDLNVLQRKVRISTIAKREVHSFDAEEVERVKGGIPAADEAGGFFFKQRDDAPAERAPEPRAKRPAARAATQEPEAAGEAPKRKPRRRRGGRGGGDTEVPQQVRSGSRSRRGGKGQGEGSKKSGEQKRPAKPGPEGQEGAKPKRRRRRRRRPSGGNNE